MLWALASAWAIELHVVDDPRGDHPFVVVDELGRPIRAWTFAHLVRDRAVVAELRPKVYSRRVGGALALGLGALAFLNGSIYVATQREIALDGIQVQPDLAVAGAVAAGGGVLVIGAVALAVQRPRITDVDAHWTEDEARAAIASRRVHVSVGPGWVAGRF